MYRGRSDSSEGVGAGVTRNGVGHPACYCFRWHDVAGKMSRYFTTDQI